jgi:hypothetical protein
VAAETKPAESVYVVPVNPGWNSFDVDGVNGAVALRYILYTTGPPQLALAACHERTSAQMLLGELETEESPAKSGAAVQAPVAAAEEQLENADSHPLVLSTAVTL